MEGRKKSRRIGSIDARRFLGDASGLPGPNGGVPSMKGAWRADGWRNRNNKWISYTMTALIDEICRYDVLLARTALEINLLTKAELAVAFTFQKRQKQRGRKITIGEAFQEKGLVCAEGIEDLYDQTKKRLDKKFGYYALKRGLATREQVDRALAEQAREFEATQACRLTGDILVDHGVVTKEERDLIRLEMKKGPSRVRRPAGSAARASGNAGSGNPPPPGEVPYRIAVSEDRMTVRILPNRNCSGPVPAQDLIASLHRETIQFGILGIEALARLLKTLDPEGHPLVVARGKRSRPGRDAAIDYRFDTSFLTAGTVDGEGNIDYRERGTRPRVKKGAPLARKIPMESGQPGIDVFGRPVPVPAVHDVQIECGEGAWKSDDGVEVFADVDGEPMLSDAGAICVCPELTIEGNVDFNSGNIEFDGNVNVLGSVMDGFSVKCTSLTATDIVGGTIVADGDVSVSGGIINTTIRARGDVEAKYITDSNIKCFGDVLVEREVIQSKIRSSGRFISELGKIIASFISAKMGFRSREVGTDVSLACRINVGLDENAKKITQGLDHIADEKKKRLERVQRAYEAQLTTRGEQDAFLSRELETIESIIGEIERISEEKLEIRNRSMAQEGCTGIKVTGCIRQGTKLFGVHSSMIARENLCNTSIREIRLPDSRRWMMVVLDA